MKARKVSSPTQAGRHAATTISRATQLKEQWAKRYRLSQEALERDRLAKGHAKHRAHVFPLTAKAAEVAA